MNGFVHSTPVPQIYKAAASIAELVQEKGQSIKELVFSKKYSRINTKGLYALIVETLQHESILCDIIRESKILADGRMKPWLARVLITELLWGKKKLPPNGCKPIQAVLDLHSEIVAISKKAVLDGTHENEPRINKAFSKPRYVRVNTLKMTIEEAMAAFVEEGWYRGYPKLPGDYRSFLEKMADIGEMEFVQDFHIPEVFAFAPRTEFYRHELYTSGCLVLQDKASCLAPYLLAPVPGSTVLDMCAAPGLKTTQLAAIMQNKGTLHAIEKSLPRHRTLLEFAKQHGANINAVHADASTLTAATLPGVEFLLVDPSCSGSGMDRPGHTYDKERVERLAGFQTILLERALLNFPNARRVVYSTCSKYPEENEHVVQRVLKTVNSDPDNPRFQLADVLPGWLSRGSEEIECGPKCVYAREDVDLTTGFFLAVFERIGDPVSEETGKRKRFRGKKANKGGKEVGGPVDAKEEQETKSGIGEVDLNGEVQFKEKRMKKKERMEDEKGVEEVDSNVVDGKRKKKKSKRKEDREEFDVNEVQVEKEGTKGNRKEEGVEEGDLSGEDRKRKKKKSKRNEEVIGEVDINDEVQVKKEKVGKRKKEEGLEEVDLNVVDGKKKKKKSKRNEDENGESEDREVRKEERKRRKREKSECNELTETEVVVKKKKDKKA